MPSVLKDPEEENFPCQDCGKERFFDKYEIKRGRHLAVFCQPCSVKNYNSGRVVQTEEERKVKARKWYQENKPQQNSYYRTYREKVKLETIEAYGGHCLHCGERDPIVLTIDHIFNDGHIDKKNGIQGGFKIYQKLKREGWPKDRYQLLCFNCNYRKEHNRRADAFGV